MGEVTLGLVFIIAVALFFDFTNGFNDAANSIATIVSTRVLTPRLAVAWAAFFNFAAFLIFGTHVATAIAKDVVVQEVLSAPVIFAGLIGAIVWVSGATYLGLPISASHSLIGGMAGAAVASAGWASLVVPGIRRIAVFIVLAPLIGLALGVTLMLIVMWMFHRSKHLSALNKGFRRMQLISAAAYSLGHGANDAQKTMGIIYALLIAQGLVGADQDVPLWVVLSAHTAIAAGTMIGGWRVIKTMGTRITHLQPVGGMCAETGAAATLFFTSIAGIPVSTTHTIAGAIVGVGATQRLSAVRWGVAGRIVWAWVFTIPGALAVSWVTYRLVDLAV